MPLLSSRTMMPQVTGFLPIREAATDNDRNCWSCINRHPAKKDRANDFSVWAGVFVKPTTKLAATDTEHRLFPQVDKTTHHAQSMAHYQHMAHLLVEMPRCAVRDSSPHDRAFAIWDRPPNWSATISLLGAGYGKHRLAQLLD